jgi:hypothetical protein
MTFLLLMLDVRVHLYVEQAFSMTLCNAFQI